MNLTEWARRQGIHPHTAYRWFESGTLPVPAERVGPRTILVNVGAAGALPAAGVGLYARVSSHDQRSDLERQPARLTEWAARAGQLVVRVESEVGSGMNGQRPQLRRLLSDPKVTTVVVEHRDRLARMNAELVEASLLAHGRRLVVLGRRALGHSARRRPQASPGVTTPDRRIEAAGQPAGVESYHVECVGMVGTGGE
ncbi:MAG: IS607 family transposase, partial [Candidatus Dormibacteria bacterium]